MTDLDHARLQAVLRRDLMSFSQKTFDHVAPAQKFSRSWHQDAIAWRLEQARQGVIRRLIITLPPRHAKSIMASIAFPAFVLGHDPTARVVCVSYSADLAAKLARDCRSVMSSAWYRRIFPGAVLSRERNAELDFMTTRRGYRLSTSVGGSLTGRGGNVIIVDDPMKPDEAMSDLRRATACEWFDNTVYSRLDDKQTDVIILIMQRLHLEDLVGHVLATGEPWVHLNLPAIADFDQTIPTGPGRFYHRKAGELLHPAREPMHVLEEMRRSIGSYHFEAQYQQNPVPVEGELIRWEWFKRYQTAPARTSHQQVVQSWDTASKAGELNDYSVCTTWLIQNQSFFLLDIFRDRLRYPALRRAVADQARRHRATAVLIEDKSSGMALAQDFKPGDLGAAGLPIAIEPELDKITRASAQSIAIESGQVFIPERADWLEDLRTELVQFPHGRFDDQIDSISQFLKWARQPRFSGARLVKLSGI
ncbi:MAG: phage terminase large subunit [Sphingomonas sp.]